MNLEQLLLLHEKESVCQLLLKKNGLQLQKKTLDVKYKMQWTRLTNQLMMIYLKPTQIYTTVLKQMSL